jgi:hypothetical protein
MALTAVSAVASMILCGLMISHTREIRSLQMQIANINNNRAVATSLVNELAEYGKKTPAIQPILQSIMPKPAAQQPAAK